MSITVKNIHGTGQDRYNPPASYNSWIDYWLRNTKLSGLPEKCPGCGRRTSNYDGAHVKKIYSSDNCWYIIPLCKECNNPYNDDTFTVDEKYLVPANEYNL